MLLQMKTSFFFIHTYLYVMILDEIAGETLSSSFFQDFTELKDAR